CPEVDEPLDLLIASISLIFDEYAGRRQRVAVTHNMDGAFSQPFMGGLSAIKPTVSLVASSGFLPPDLLGDILAGAHEKEKYFICSYFGDVRYELSERITDPTLVSLFKAIRNKGIFNLEENYLPLKSCDRREDISHIISLLKHKYIRASNFFRAYFYFGIFSGSILEKTFKNSDFQNLKLRELKIFFEMAGRVSSEFLHRAPQLSKNIKGVSEMTEIISDYEKNVERYILGEESNIDINSL